MWPTVLLALTAILSYGTSLERYPWWLRALTLGRHHILGSNRTYHLMVKTWLDCIYWFQTCSGLGQGNIIHVGSECDSWSISLCSWSNMQSLDGTRKPQAPILEFQQNVFTLPAQSGPEPNPIRSHSKTTYILSINAWGALMSEPQNAKSSTHGRTYVATISEDHAEVPWLHIGLTGGSSQCCTGSIINCGTSCDTASGATCHVN